MSDRRFSRLLSAGNLVALALCLAACGGGGGDRPGSMPTPTPAPPPAPPPPPTAAQDFTKTAPVSMKVGVHVRDAGNGRNAVASVERLDDVQPPLSNFLAITYLGPDSYGFDWNRFGGTVVEAADKVSEPTGLFDHWRTPLADNHAAEVQLAKRGAGGVTLTYLSYGALFETTSSDGDALLTFFYGGQGTIQAEMPTTGTATYSGIVDGLWVDGSTTRRLFGSEARLVADFATGTVTSTLELVGRGDPFGDFMAAPATTLGTFTGTGFIDGVTFGGRYADTAGYSGGFDGNFFGPAADEYGLVFSLTGGPGQGVIGVVVGTR
jgi:hypothetical protein